MNKARVCIVGVGALFICIIVLYPPFINRTKAGGGEKLGHAFIGDGPGIDEIPTGEKDFLGMPYKEYFCGDLKFNYRPHPEMDYPVMIAYILVVILLGTVAFVVEPFISKRRV